MPPASSTCMDYAPPPGTLLEEMLETIDISARELARRCGRSAKLITEILSAKAPLEPETALQFERVLGIEASIWLGMEAAYRLHEARKVDDRNFADYIPWARSFPLADLHKRGKLPSAQATAETVKSLLEFFGVASVKACEDYCDSYGVAYRHSQTYDSNRQSVFAWLRIGELEAATITCEDYDRSKLISALETLRTVTTVSEPKVFIPRIKAELASAGVAFVIEKSLANIALSGVSRWLSPRKALIQQTCRHMADDHFWFTLFHEAAHILLHSRKSVFVEGKGDTSGTAAEEEEANAWAANFLIPRAALSNFISAGEFTLSSVRRFAREQEIAPGIVVGQLQKAGEIGWNSFLNKLKVRYEWKD